MSMASSSDPSVIVSKKKGGLKTMPLIIANETFEKVAGYGLQANMVVYLTKYYNMPIVSAASLLFIWSATSSFIPIIGAFLSDSYLGRFKTIAFGSISSFLGMVLLWLTSEIPQTRPPSCNSSPNSCEAPNSLQMTILLSSFILLSIGSGGVRPCSMAFGVDQLDQTNPKIVQSYFSWYYISICFASMVSVTAIVYIQEHKGWNLGLGVPAIVMFVATILFVFGSSIYIKRKPDASKFTGLAKVIVAALRKRKYAPSPQNMARWYHQKGSSLISPSDRLRCLNKACMIKDPEKDLNPDGSPSNPWNLCTVEQTEALKSLLKLIPICSTGMVIALTSSQQSFVVLQANTMNRHIGRNFQIPAASYSTFQVVALTTWVVIYDRVINPAVRKRTGKLQAVTATQRMGIGLFISFTGAVVAAIVEKARREMAIRQGFTENSKGLVAMSAMWLVPQQCLTGLAEAFNAIAQTEFYYSQLPKSMASAVMAILTLGAAFGGLLGSLLLQIVDGITKRGGRTSWVANNLNTGHYDYYYWLLAILNLFNCAYFVICIRTYGSVQQGTWAAEEMPDEAKPRELEISHV